MYSQSVIVAIRFLAIVRTKILASVALVANCRDDNPAMRRPASADFFVPNFPVTH